MNDFLTTLFIIKGREREMLVPSLALLYLNEFLLGQVSVETLCLALCNGRRVERVLCVICLCIFEDIYH
jgi:hypothetical protein